MSDEPQSDSASEAGGDSPASTEPPRATGLFTRESLAAKAARAVAQEGGNNTSAATAAIFDQDAAGEEADDSTPEPEAPAEEPTEVILTRMAEISADPDGMDEQLRNNKLHDIRVQAALLPDDELGKFCAFVVANGDQFDARTVHYVVKQLLLRHPKVTEQEPSLPGNVLGGVARRVIEGDYTWDNLVIHPPRPKPEPSEEPSVTEGSSDPGDDGSIDEITPVNSEDPILARLRQQNAELAALGF